MILEKMISIVMNRTQSNDQGSIIDELNSAQDAIWNRIITNNANILKVDDCEITLAAQTSSYNLAANVTSGTLVEIKWLGVKFSGDTVFNPVVWIDSSSDDFIAADQNAQPASSSPVFAASENFNQVRFAPPLPSGTILRVDYIYSPVDLGLSTRVISDLPFIVHESLTDKATAQTYVNIDDMTRAQYWDIQAASKLMSAQNVLNRRQYQQQPRIRSSNHSRGGGGSWGPF